MDPIFNFKGIFQRGTEDTTPEDHFLDSLNIEFPLGGVETRKGMELDFTIATVRRILLYKRLNEATRILILTDGGNLWDSIQLSYPILTIAGMTDFSAVNFYNRMYISPHNGKKGLANESVRVYDGTTMRVAGGTQPAGTLIAANSGASGKIEAGTHLFAVVFESPSGHLSKPGPTVYASVVAPGAKKVDLSGIPLPPPGSTRRIIATHAIPTYSGNQFGYEYFFIPDGTITNPAATTFTVDFYDSELMDDANYLNEIRSTIPAGLVMSSFEGRMLVANTDSDPNMMLVSRTNDPEVFDEADDIIIVDPTEAGGITNANEHHGLLIINKSFRSYTTTDNGAEPNTWKVLPFDKSIGTEVHGVGKILDANGVSTDRFVMASRVGLVMYDGTFNTVELTFKIENLWKRINPNAFHTIQVAIDPINKEIFIALPIDSATLPDYLLYGDYSEGLDYQNIKWTLWRYPWVATTILIDVINNAPMLKVGSIAGNIYKRTTAIRDDSTAIDSFIESALIPQDHSGNIRHFNWFRTKIIGYGNVEVSTRGRNNNQPRTYNEFALYTNGEDTTRRINYQGERLAIKLRTNEIDEHWHMNSFVVSFRDKFVFRPQ